jgi:hypothetical protein
MPWRAAIIGITWLGFFGTSQSNKPRDSDIRHYEFVCDLAIHLPRNDRE